MTFCTLTQCTEFETLAVEIAGFLNLPLKVIPDGEIALSPAAEQVERKSRDDL